MSQEDGKDIDGESVGTGNDARIALLNSIADQNDGGRADEFEAINDDGTTEAFVVQQADGDTEPLTDDIAPDPETDATIQALADETAEPEDEPQRFKVKVNGRELMLTQEELIARAQKVEAADQYLAEAARIRNEHINKTRPPVQDGVLEPTVDDDLAIVRAIQMGTEEEAVKALAKLRQSQKSLSPDDISRTIDERLTFNEAINKFRTEYNDITSDPYLNKLALDTDAQLLANGDRRPYYERYAEIGENLRGWAKKTAERYAPAPSEQNQHAKSQRKAAATSVPTSQSRKTQSSIDAEPEETVSDTIAAIAKSRGGPQWMQTRH